MKAGTFFLKQAIVELAADSRQPSWRYSRLYAAVALTPKMR